MKLTHRQKMKYSLIAFYIYMFGLGLFYADWYLAGALGIVVWVGWTIYLLRKEADETEERIKRMVDAYYR